MTKRNSAILMLLFAILVVEIVILAPGDLGTSPEADRATALQNTAKGPAETATGQVMQDVHLVEAKPGGKEWELWAKRAVRPKENAMWTIETVEIKFFGENEVVYTVTGDKGFVETTKNDIRIMGNVLMKSTNGYTFKTEAMFYQSQKRMLETPHEISMAGPPEPDGTRFTLTGKDLIANLESNEIFIRQDVRAKKTVKTGKAAIIASNSAEFSGKTKKGRFYNGTVIDIESLRITGPEAIFAYKGNTIESVAVEGGVKVTDVDKYATADRVAVYLAEEKYIFKGSPRVVQSGDELFGDEIILSQGGRKVQVSNAKAKIDSRNLETKAEKRP
jgi:LPS export ABC transporter protein LptC